ncbi:MAG: hypothetical protein AB8D78_10770 [Akkermansiaceae bacterium]
MQPDHYGSSPPDGPWADSAKSESSAFAVWILLSRWNAARHRAASASGSTASAILSTLRTDAASGAAEYCETGAKTAAGPFCTDCGKHSPEEGTNGSHQAEY